VVKEREKYVKTDNDTEFALTRRRKKCGRKKKRIAGISILKNKKKKKLIIKKTLKRKLILFPKKLFKISKEKQNPTICEIS
jgi:hypothetical protein